MMVDAGTTIVAAALGSTDAEVTVAVGATTVGDGVGDGFTMRTSGRSGGDGGFASTGVGASWKAGAAPRATKCGRGTSVGTSASPFGPMLTYSSW